MMLTKVFGLNDIPEDAPSREEGRRRLLVVSAYLDGLPEKEFDYCHVGHACGTPACAIGHAGTIPELMALGLGFKFGRVSWKGNGTAFFIAGSHAFGLTQDEALYLFGPLAPLEDLPRSPGVDATPKEVADHIRRFAG